MTHVIGIDIMTMLFEHAIADPAIRSNIPLKGSDPAEQRAWVEGLVDRVAEIGRSAAFHAAIGPMHEAFHYHRGGIHLPGDALAESDDDRFEVAVKSIKVVRQNGKALLESARGQVPIPGDIVEPVSWIVDTGSFSGNEFAKAFPDLDAAARAKLIQDLSSMRVIAPA